MTPPDAILGGLAVGRRKKLSFAIFASVLTNYQHFKSMKLYALIIIQLFVFAGKPFAQYIENPVPGIPWEKVVLNNHATFNHYSNLEWGSGFLIQYKDEVIACTAREFTGTMSTRDDMLYVKNFDRELRKWIMYLPYDLSQYVELDSLVFRKRIERN
jgi:hypothetical protein